MQNKRVFVFSSNVEGRHTTGTALRAYEDHGAVYGEGYGLQGSSFAIPVKDENFKFLPLHKIKSYVDKMLRYAELNPDITFQVTQIGCGLGGYDEADIAPMFRTAPMNCILPVGWRNYK